jgi:hypothetical protein
MRYIVLVVGAAVLISGCGGPRNPLHANVSVPKVLTGFWDGLTVLVAMVFTLFNPHRYRFFMAHQHFWYWLGFIVGIVVLLSLISAMFGGYRSRRVTTVRRTL